MNRVCVVGAGALGSLFAAQLCRVAETWVLVRRAEQARAIERQGLTVSGAYDLTSQPRATADPGALPECDVVIFAARATDLDAAATRLEGRLSGAIVVTVQAGFGAEEIVARHGTWPLVSGLTSMRCVRRSDTSITCSYSGSTLLGPWPPAKTPVERAEAVRDLLAAAGLEAHAAQDIRPSRWSNLVSDAVVSTVAALTGAPHSRGMVDGDLAGLVRSAIAEGRTIAKAAGIPLADDPWELNVRVVEHGDSPGVICSHAVSTQLDVERRRPTEVEFCIGVLVREAERVHVDAPLLSVLYRLLLARESSWTQPQGV